MKGEYSKNNLFKRYPSLYVNSYQGSLTSSSSEIKKIFDHAKKVIEKQKDKNKNISVILFDEMGLAEISPLNPLKVIHSELDGKQEVAFVGISNWILDASKMNRAIHLSGCQHLTTLVSYSFYLFFLIIISHLAQLVVTSYCPFLFFKVSGISFCLS